MRGKRDGVRERICIVVWDELNGKTCFVFVGDGSVCGDIVGRFGGCVVLKEGGRREGGGGEMGGFVIKVGEADKEGISLFCVDTIVICPEAEEDTAPGYARIKKTTKNHGAKIS